MAVTGLILIFFSSCNDTMEPDNSRFGYDFFPLNTGHYRIYNVKEILFTSDLEVDTLIYELKEVITDSVRDKAGEISYLLQRLKRSESEPAWVLDSIWIAYKNDIRATVYENSIPVIKLVFPFENNKAWDSNGLNERYTDDFKMEKVFEPYSSTFGEYEQTVTVIQEEKLDSIAALDYRYEIYARQIGLVEKVSSKLDFCQADPCFGQKIIESGRIMTQLLTDYGNE